MKIIRNILIKIGAISALFVLPLSAFAGPGTVIFAPASISIPTLSSSMLIVLSLLLMIVAFRVAKQKGSKKFFMVLMGASILMASSGGIKLVSDIQASGSVSFSMPEGDSVNIQGVTLNEIQNLSGVVQSVIEINAPEGCGNFPNAVGVSQYPECSVGQRLDFNAEITAFCFVDCRTTTQVVGKPAQ